ncbi:insulinase, putative [Plasmodium ovale]|uniref:Insulinase, putative n=1 Tax=Plasmodium ovale TaxID=36330 RepID=A0A1C3KSJ0_PLAOA|nr:insulinase, putative [Plasmodium ovale]
MTHDYVRVSHVPLEQGLAVDEYYSMKSGLRIVLSKIKSPKIYGYFTLLTEAENDEGLPHTLEHLIFLGSHKYPHKGLLDFLAYKCLSEGTNAWTSIDHTCYTIETFGIEGFSNILPIYLDFILNPTLHDDMFLSEVHHIFENGTHNGVVYSEMKSIENNCENIVERTVITNLYPNEKSGYRFETGGTLDGLRKTSNKRVKEYFTKFYKLNNFAIIIFGNFENDAILEIINQFEEYHLALNPSQRRMPRQGGEKGAPAPEQVPASAATAASSAASAATAAITATATEMLVQDLQSASRPWSEEANVEKRTDSKIVKKYYPCNNLNNGQVTIAWRGCDWADFKTKLAISLLGNYLTDLTTSPVSKRLLEDKENTYCSSLDFALEDLKGNYFTIDIYDVSHKFRASKRGKSGEKPGQAEEEAHPGQAEEEGHPGQAEEEGHPGQAVNAEKPTECDEADVKMNLVGEITRKCVREVFEGALNMGRLRNIIIRSYLQHLRDLETSPQYLLNELIIKYIIYGKKIEDLYNCLNLRKIYMELLKEKERYWKDILKIYFIENNYVEVRCYPSYKRAKELEIFERNLIENEQIKYGTEKLNKMVKNIKKIKENMEKKPPKELLNMVESAKAKNVKIDGITIFRNFKSVKKNIILNEHCNNVYTSNENKVILHKIEKDLKRIIFPVQLSNIQSNFVSLNVLINSSNISYELKKYIPLLSYLLFETDVEINNRNVKCELFMEELIRNTINYDCNYGLGGNAKNFRSGNLGNILCIQIIGLIENYEKLFDLLFISFLKMNLTLERLEIILKSAYQNLLQKKNKPKTLVINLEYALRYEQNSNSGFVSIGQQELILQTIENKKNLHHLYDKLNTLKNELFDLKNIALVIDGNFTKLQNIFDWYDRWFHVTSKSVYTVKSPQIDFPLDSSPSDSCTAWYLVKEESHPASQLTSQLTAQLTSQPTAQLTSQLTSQPTAQPTAQPIPQEALANGIATTYKEPIGDAPCSDTSKYVCLGPEVHKSLKEHLSADFENENKNFELNVINDKAYNAIVCGIKSTDVSYLKLTVKAPSGYDHKDYCALLILREFFSMTEGPLYNSIRGGGFAYECALDFNCISGELSLRIYRSSDIISALKEALKILNYYCNNQMKEDELSIAKSSAYYTIFNNQETTADRATQTIFLSLKNVNLNFYENLLTDIYNITTGNILTICQKYISKIVQFKINKEHAIIGSTLCIICCSEKTEEIETCLKRDLNFGTICNLSVQQLFSYLRSYDMESCLKQTPSRTDPGAHSGVVAEEEASDGDGKEDDAGESFDDSCDDSYGDSSGDSAGNSSGSVYSDDDSYPGQSEH